MPTTQVHFVDLPRDVRAAVEGRTGPILKVEAVASGLNSALSARIQAETGPAFLKGLPSDHKWIWTQQREAEVNPHVVPLAPRLLWHVETGGWNILGFEAVDGHHADYTPGSPDLPKVVNALRRLGEITCPEIPLRQAEQRLSAYVDRPDDLQYFTGDNLLHTDFNNHNVLVNDRAHIVDWAWATRGAPWLDPGYWIIWLIAAGGHAPAQAEELARQIPSWGTAPPRAVDAFAGANLRIWEEIAGDSPDPWTARMVTAATAWQEHRSR